MPGKFFLVVRQKFIRLRHWEYWPFDVVYFPIYFYWFYLMLKSRSFFFFNTANPLIKNGGFLMESKKEIYDFIPPGYYPKTILVRPGTPVETLIKELLKAAILFPLVAKPDIGMRGLGVAVIKNMAELESYLLKSKVEFLVQEYIACQNEVGIFYYRMPGNKKGVVSGIVGKEFLSVQGDGASTIAQLLWQNQRAVLQWQILHEQYGDGLEKVLESGDVFMLVPYGNHSRGAKFIDLSFEIDAALTTTVDSICQAVPEFYYGRLDIRFASWEALRKGEAFSIIELNGAGSEPTHIYDPEHSIFFAWQEIIRHLNVLYKISKANKAQQNLTYMTTQEGMAMLRANKKHVALLSQ